MMIVSRKHLPRRTFLRGLGTAIALPLLDSMRPALAAPARTGKPPVRLVFTYVPNGIMMKDWTPSGEGKDFVLPRILQPLAAFRQDTLVLTGLSQYQANELGDGGGGHARAAAVWLTGVHPKKTAGADIRAGISADQVAAQAIGNQTKLASLEMGCEDSRTVGNCDSGYSCAYTNSISWRTPTIPLPPENNPRVIFERLFGTGEHNLTPEQRARVADDRRSILDTVQGETQRLIGRVGPADRRKIDEYLTAVREIERRIGRAEKEDHELRPTIEKPSGVPGEFAAYVKLMYDLQIAALQADITRVVTMMVAREGSVRTYPELGIPDGHHPLTHHRNNPEWIEKVTRINVYHTELFAYYLDRVKRTQDGDGTLLDNSMVVYGSGLSDGNGHVPENLPTLLFGKGGGAVHPGRHVAYAKKTPLNNLYLSLMDGVGLRPESVGDSTGRLDRLAGL